MTCPCDPFTPAIDQTLCADCMAHRVGNCDTCGMPSWWTDMVQMQHTDGTISEHCAGCADWRETGE